MQVRGMLPALVRDFGIGEYNTFLLDGGGRLSQVGMRGYDGLNK